MRSLLVVCQVRADPIDHHHHQGAISNIQPIASSNKLAGSISCKRATSVSAKVWFVKAGHDRLVRLFADEVFHERAPKYTRSRSHHEKYLTGDINMRTALADTSSGVERIGRFARRRLSEHQKCSIQSPGPVRQSSPLQPCAELARDAAVGSIPASPPREGATARGAAG
jgi:hypothetical protein